MEYFRLLRYFITNDNNKDIIYGKQSIYLNPKAINYYHYNNGSISNTVTLYLRYGKTIIVEKSDFEKNQILKKCAV